MEPIFIAKKHLGIYIGNTVDWIAATRTYGICHSPVAVLIKFTDFKEAVKMVNDGDYGLQTGLFTKDLNRVFYAFDNLEVGGVVVNDVSAARVDSMPVRVGGNKQAQSCYINLTLKLLLLLAVWWY
jgi:hypothetical protein